MYSIYIYKIFKKQDKNIDEEETVFNIQNVSWFIEGKNTCKIAVMLISESNWYAERVHLTALE